MTPRTGRVGATRPFPEKTATISHLRSCQQSRKSKLHNKLHTTDRWRADWSAEQFVGTSTHCAHARATAFCEG